MSEWTEVVDFREAEYDIYIGRANTYYGMPRSPLHNPYKEADYGRKRAVDLFAEMHADRLERQPSYAEYIDSIQGKTLGCYCPPKLCHGEVIADNSVLDR